MGNSHAGQGSACLASSPPPFSHLSLQATPLNPHLRKEKPMKKSEKNIFDLISKYTSASGLLEGIPPPEIRCFLDKLQLKPRPRYYCPTIITYNIKLSVFIMVQGISIINLRQKYICPKILKQMTFNDIKWDQFCGKSTSEMVIWCKNVPNLPNKCGTTSRGNPLKTKVAAERSCFLKNLMFE